MCSYITKLLTKLQTYNLLNCNFKPILQNKVQVYVCKILQRLVFIELVLLALTRTH